MEERSYRAWIGHNLYDRGGSKVGAIENVYVDDSTGRPEWLAVSTGWFGTNVSFVPIQGTAQHQDGLRVGYDSETIKHAPHVESDGALSQEEERRLYQHYGFDYESGVDTFQTADRYDADYDEYRRDDIRDRTSTDHDVITRSEEELRVDRRSEEKGRVRLHKYVVTEDETVTVPVQKERVRVEREPITDTNAESPTGEEIAEADLETIVHEERPVVTTEAVPKERIRLEKDVVTEEETVSGKVRKERVEVDAEGETLDDVERDRG